MTIKTTALESDRRGAKIAAGTQSLRPVLLPHSAQGRVGSPRTLTFGWAQTSGRRFGR